MTVCVCVCVCVCMCVCACAWYAYTHTHTHTHTHTQYPQAAVPCVWYTHTHTHTPLKETLTVQKRRIIMQKRPTSAQKRPTSAASSPQRFLLHRIASTGNPYIPLAPAPCGDPMLVRVAARTSYHVEKPILRQMDLSALSETLRYEAARCCGWSAYRWRASRSICTGCLSPRAARSLQLEPLKADLLLGNIDTRAGALPTPADGAGDAAGDAASGRSNALVGDEGATTSVACACADAGSRTCIHERSAAAAASQDSSCPSTASISRRARVLASPWGLPVTGRVEAEQPGAGNCCVDTAVAFMDHTAVASTARVRGVGATGKTLTSAAILRLALRESANTFACA